MLHTILFPHKESIYKRFLTHKHVTMKSAQHQHKADIASTQINELLRASSMIQTGNITEATKRISEYELTTESFSWV